MLSDHSDDRSMEQRLPEEGIWTAVDAGQRQPNQARRPGQCECGEQQDDSGSCSLQSCTPLFKVTSAGCTETGPGVESLVVTPAHSLTTRVADRECGLQALTRSSTLEREENVVEQDDDEDGEERQEHESPVLEG